MIGLTPPLEGGSERVIHELSSRIPNCTVLTQRGSICRKKIEIPVPKKPTLLRNIIFAVFVKIYVLFLLLTFRKKYDVIHIHENLLYCCAIPLSWRYKVVVTVHGMRGFKFYDSRFLWFFFKLGLKFADRIISVSLSDKKLLDREFNNVIYIPNGVDLSVYNNLKAKTEKKIIFIGRIHEQKGIVYLLRAFENIKDRNLRLEIIGEINDYARELQQKFNDGRIIWRGFVSNRKEIARTLKSAYCIVLPSLWEGLPLTLFEAMASGRPVILSDINAFKSVARDEAVFFRAKDSRDLENKIKLVMKNEKMAESLGKKGKKLSEGYDWGKISRRTVEIYENNL
jgi:glycosyltransferase involved in cell wall biosynthesis